MSRFKIKFKLQGLELDIEGDRRDVGIISQAVGQQVANLIAPTGDIVDGAPSGKSDGMIDVTPSVQQKRESKSTKRKTSKSAAQSGSSTTIDFRHSPEKFGVPSQGWKTAQKAIWLLFVLGELGEQRPLTTGTIASTFNKHFKQSGTVNNSNVSRDLGRAKIKSGDSFPLVGEDTSKSPPEWFLTDEVKKQARALIEESLGAAG